LNLAIFYQLPLEPIVGLRLSVYNEITLENGSIIRLRAIYGTSWKVSSRHHLVCSEPHEELTQGHLRLQLCLSHGFIFGNNLKEIKLILIEREQRRPKMTVTRLGKVDNITDVHSRKKATYVWHICILQEIPKHEKIKEVRMAYDEIAYAEKVRKVVKWQNDFLSKNLLYITSVGIPVFPD